VVAVSRDLPFAQKRWCGTEGVERVITASDYKYRTFGEQFGVRIVDWDLLSRAVFIADSAGTVQYVEYVPEVSAEPSYEEALKVARRLAN
jgi:thioredoxin-dependent peroxiredoxin